MSTGVHHTLIFRGKTATSFLLDLQSIHVCSQCYDRTRIIPPENSYDSCSSNTCFDFQVHGIEDIFHFCGCPDLFITRFRVAMEIFPVFEVCVPVLLFKGFYKILKHDETSLINAFLKIIQCRYCNRQNVLLINFNDYYLKGQP